MSAELQHATEGFDLLFVNDLDGAKQRCTSPAAARLSASLTHAGTVAAGQSPFHSMGAGVCAFLQAALGMEARVLAGALGCGSCG